MLFPPCCSRHAPGPANIADGVAASARRDDRRGSCVRRGLAEASEILFFVACYGWLIWRFADPQLLYHADWVALAPASGHVVKFPLFYLGRDFLGDFTAYPGGLPDYAGAFLSQLFYYPAVGASLLAMVGAAYVLVTDRLLKDFGGSGSVRLLRYAPPLALLAAYLHSTYVLADSLRWLIPLLATLAYVRIRPRWFVLRATMVALLASCLFWLVGGAPLPNWAPQLLFAVLCGLFEVRAAGGGRLRWTLIAAAAAAAGPTAAACAGGSVWKTPNMSVYPPPGQTSAATPEDVAPYAVIGLLVMLGASTALFLSLLNRIAPEKTPRWTAWARKLAVNFPSLALRLTPLLLWRARRPTNEARGRTATTTG